ncbi:MAG TPA: hypothetical protein VMT43_07980 [Acidimicrobiales bacterium]|nr:hypothetical protein [Acidimicrobiales bacterium]
MPPPSDPITRRALLVGVAGLAGTGLLAACGSSRGSTGSGASSPRTGVAVDPKTHQPIAVPLFDVGDPYVVSGTEQRLVVGLQGPDGAAAARIPSPAEVTVRSDATHQVVAGPMTVAAHHDGTPIAYYPILATFPAPGTYVIELRVDAGRTTQAVQVSDPKDVHLVQRGQPMRPVDTPTPADHRGVEPICTRSPMCAFHSMTLTDALKTGKPTAFLVSTPEFCQIGVCGPSLDLLIEAAPRHPGVQFLHAEVYTDAARLGSIQGAKLTPAVVTYALTYEPVLFVADGRGRLVDRLDNVFDRADLEAALATVS